jgi:hypothetical protein
MTVHTFDGDVTTDPPDNESHHRYPRRAIFVEYFYAALGVVLTLGPFAIVLPLIPIAGILAALGLLFVAFGVRTVIRHNAHVRISDDGVIVDGLVRKHLMWEELTRYKLGYYSTKRDQRGGWMQLKLKAGRRGLRIDSQIQGFETIVRRSARAALDRKLELDLATLENLHAFGVADLPAEAA